MVIDILLFYRLSLKNVYANIKLTSHLFPATIFKMIRENMMRTKIDGMCRWPNKKVIEMPQHPSKMYSPRKYVIRQCSDETACCGSSDKTCVAKKVEELTLWFHVRYVSWTAEIINKNRQNTNLWHCKSFSVDWHLRPQEEANYKMMMNRSWNVFLRLQLSQKSEIMLKVKTNFERKGKRPMMTLHDSPSPSS